MSSVKKYGIDVSEHQGNIDWKKVKNAGIEFAIIRCGYGDDITLQDDKYFKNNIEGCEKNGIPYGVYIYSYATSVMQAESEAQHVVRLIKGHKLTYPVFLDLEDNNTSGKLAKKALGDIAETFCKLIEAAGYKVGIYANTSWFNGKLTDRRFDKWDRWVAQYYKECEYKKEHVGWQFSDAGKVDGIKTKVDVNYFYKDYAGDAPKPIKKPAKKTVDELAKEVLDGKWGNGAERKEKLIESGYDYDAVQKRVNQLLTPAFEEYPVKVTVDALNIRSGPGTNTSKVGMIKDKGTYIIVEESNGVGAKKWGKLKNGAGWIALDYTMKI